MAGMEVTVYFAGGTNYETRSWSALPTGIGVQGTNWSLFESGDTYSNPWTLTSTGAAIQKIVLDGLPGKTVFDISDANDFFTQEVFDSSDGIGTSGSAQGLTFVVSSNSYTGAVNATYNSLIYFSNSHFVPKRAILNGIEGFTGSIGGCVTHSCSAFSARRLQATCFCGPLGSSRAH